MQSREPKVVCAEQEQVVPAVEHEQGELGKKNAYSCSYRERKQLLEVTC